jgi:hypothetical protein
MAEKARFERRGDVGVVTIDDRPLNLFGPELARDLLAAPLLDTEDLKGAVRSFLEEGPGKATFTGR